MKDNAAKERFVELRAAGMSYAKIATELSVSKQTLINWSKGLAEEIGNLRALEWEALREKHLVAKEHRIELFGSLLKRITGEIERRELRNIPTDRLIALLLKLSESLKSDETPVTFSQKEAIDESLFCQAASWNG